MGPDKKASSNALRAAKILIALGDASQPGLTLSELSARLNDAKSAVHRALVALGQFGFTEQSGRRGAYRLGPSIYALANKSHSITDMVNFFRPILIAVGGKPGFPIYLMFGPGLVSLSPASPAGTNPTPAMFEGIGGRLPLGVGLGGGAVLGQMDPISRRKIMEVNADRYRQWGVEAATIDTEIAMLKEKGYVCGVRKNKNVDITNIAFFAEKAALYNSQAGISLLLPNEMDQESIQKLVSAVKKCME